jgi:hypothetical protein
MTNTDMRTLPRITCVILYGISLYRHPVFPYELPAMAHATVTGGSDTFLINEKEKDTIVIGCSMRDVHCYDVNESHCA